ncbi:unnamed protein product [Rhodiola kirilowii]
MDIMSVVRPDHEEDDAGKVGCFRTGETLIRLLPLGLCVAALVLMLNNSESNEYGSLSYSDLGAFRYLVHANGICAAYSLLSAIFAARLQSSKPRAWTFFLLDQVLTYVILAAGAVACELLYSENKGDEAVTWSEACGSYGKFCHKATASVAMTFVSVVVYAGLSLISSYRLFSKFDAPVCYHTGSGKGIENPVFQG